MEPLMLIEVGSPPKLTLRILLWIMHGEEQGEGGPHRFLPTAAQTAVLNFTAKQLPDDGLSRGTHRAATS